MAENDSAQLKFKKKLEGVVSSNKNDKTIVVSVTRRFKHRTYNKFISRSKKYHAHDLENKAKVGDSVTIVESRPYSRLKQWELLTIHA